MTPKASEKHQKISKASSTMVTTVAIGTFITVFCLISSKVLLSQAAFQHRLLDARNEAIASVKKNKTNATQLVSYYNDVFIGKSPVNIIGGSNTSNTNASPPDGDNSHVVLDALPASYDFPALLSSITKIFLNNGAKEPTITAADESITANTTPSSTPQAVEIKVSATGRTNYRNVQKIIRDFERSIRPFKITKLELSGNNSEMTFNMDLTTYYQPPKNLTIGSKEVK